MDRAKESEREERREVEGAGTMREGTEGGWGEGRDMYKKCR